MVVPPKMRSDYQPPHKRWWRRRRACVAITITNCWWSFLSFLLACLLARLFTLASTIFDNYALLLCCWRSCVCCVSMFAGAMRCLDSSYSYSSCISLFLSFYPVCLPVSLCLCVVCMGNEWKMRMMRWEWWGWLFWRNRSNSEWVVDARPFGRGEDDEALVDDKRIKSENADCWWLWWPEFGNTAAACWLWLLLLFECGCSLRPCDRPEVGKAAAAAEEKGLWWWWGLNGEEEDLALPPLPGELSCFGLDWWLWCGWWCWRLWGWWWFADEFCCLAPCCCCCCSKNCCIRE